LKRLRDGTDVQAADQRLDDHLQCCAQCCADLKRRFLETFRVACR
jgi:hypothetical protein